MKHNCLKPYLKKTTYNSTILPSQKNKLFLINRNQTKMMIDTTQIKEAYAQMTDEQLIGLANTEGFDLTGEALTVLHNEFLKRNLDMAILESVDNSKAAQQNRNVLQAQNSASDQFAKSIWTYAFDEKKAGATDEEIKIGLIAHGLGEEHAEMVIKSLESKVRELVSSHNSNMLLGAAICGVGLLITFGTMSSASNGGSYTIAWGAIIFGGIRFFKGLSNKSDYSTILENIEAEKDIIITEFK